MSRKLVGILMSLIPATALLTIAGPAAAATNDTAIGTFSSHDVVGYSVFIEKAASITVSGAYTGLKPNRAYFTVIYSNAICDPAQAFPIGPFWSDSHGRGRINQSVPNVAGVSVGATLSVSVRRGDTQADLDHDGLLGPRDVVAVPGFPRIGLVHCDGSPTIIGA